MTMMAVHKSRAVALGLAALVIGAVPAGAAVARPSAPKGPVAVPIPTDPRTPQLRSYLGAPTRPRPLPGTGTPQHPYMAVQSNIHNDAYQTDAYDYPGPLGRRPQVTSGFQGGECAFTAFDKKGRIVTVCIPVGLPPRLMLIDPKTMGNVAAFPLPMPPLTGSFTDFSGGGYFYLDDQDRAVVPTKTGKVLVVAIEGDAFKLSRSYDLTPVIGGAGISSALPDWAGRLWFVTNTGIVGVIDQATGQIQHTRFAGKEINANSFAVDETGGVFIVGDHALYRFDADGAGAPKVTWRKEYDRGSRTKPGQVSQGSGTTPTLIGSGSGAGGGYVAITDNADPKMNVLVYERGKQGPGDQPICKQPVFASGRSADENSLVSVGGDLIAENNYGYEGPNAPQGNGRLTPDTEPGLVRVNVDYKKKTCKVVWQNTTERIPSVVAKAALGNGVLYAYTHPTVAETRYRGPGAAPDAWYFTAFDLRTGKRLWSKLAGSGIFYNNHYAPITVGRDGSAYVGTFGGIIRVADAR